MYSPKWWVSYTKNININELKVDFVPRIWDPLLPDGSHLGKWLPQYENLMWHYSFRMFPKASTINSRCYFPQQYQHEGVECGFCDSYICQFCSLAAVLENGCHGRHGTNPECLQSLKWPLWCIVWVCQVSCFYHKVHDFSVIRWTTCPRRPFAILRLHILHMSINFLPLLLITLSEFCLGITLWSSAM